MFGFPGSKVRCDKYPGRGCDESQSTVLSEVIALAVRKTKPVEVPNTTLVGSDGDTAIVLTLPALAGMMFDAWVHMAAPLVDRHRALPPMYSRVERLGSITNGVTNRKFVDASVIPVVADTKE